MIGGGAFMDAVRFWEPGRLAYNGVLAAALFAFVMATDSWMQVGRGFGFVVVLGIIANLFYCAAYPIDFIMQATPAAALWRRWRWIAWASGMAFALLLAVVALFGISGPLPR